MDLPTIYFTTVHSYPKVVRKEPAVSSGQKQDGFSEGSAESLLAFRNGGRNLEDFSFFFFCVGE